MSSEREIPSEVCAAICALCMSALAAGGCTASADAVTSDGESVEVASEAIMGGTDDVDTREANVVVRLSGATRGGCTGILITPIAVLTAKHCVEGSIRGDVVRQGLDYPISVAVGASTAVFGDCELPSQSCFRTSTAGATVMGARAPTTADDAGRDLAILWLDRPVLERANIVRPSLTAPTPFADEAYSDIGMAGWSSWDSDTARQVHTPFRMHLEQYAQMPDGLGQIWERERDSVRVHPGDSGGPLFVRRADGTRDPIGISSLMVFDSIWADGTPLEGDDIWTDITRGANADWIRHIMVDDSRGPNWRAMHPGYSWIGEVEYLGACDRPLDTDCDHWRDEHDNCPFVGNPDQRDANDDMRGDACRNSWAPIGGWIQGGAGTGATRRQSHDLVYDEARRGLEIVGLGSDWGIWARREDSTLDWAPWRGTDRPGEVHTITAHGLSDGLDVFGIGMDDHAYFTHRDMWSDTHSYWSPVPGLEGLPVVDVQVVPATQADEMLFALTAQGAIHRVPIRAWATSGFPHHQDGRYFATPTIHTLPTGLELRRFAAGRVDDTLQLAATDEDGTVWHLGEERTTRVARICIPGRACRFYHYETTDWGAWQSIGFGSVCEADSCFVSPSEHTQLEVVDSGGRPAVLAVADGAVHQSVRSSLAADATMSAWRTLPFGVRIREISTISGYGGVFVAGVGEDGTVRILARDVGDADDAWFSARRPRASHPALAAEPGLPSRWKTGDHRGEPGHPRRASRLADVRRPLRRVVRALIARNRHSR